jgi:hypothetical protein
MRLDSVRELKADINRRTLAPVVRAAATGRGLALSAQPVTAVDDLHRTFALGIAMQTRTDFKLAVRIQRRSFESSPQIENIRALARGEVDVRYVGRIVKRAVPWHQRRNRPLRVGGSIGHFAITAGTLGCFVQRRSDDQVFILSNNHVLANENDAAKGDAIIQPGDADGGRRPRNRIGSLDRFVKLRKRGVNFIDCALARVNTGIRFNHTGLTGIGNLAGVGPDAVEDAAVAKVGRTTGMTRGTVTAFEIDNVVVGYDLGNLRFDNQIEIEGAGDEAFSDGGDSGSLIVNAENLGVALLFAGGDQGGSNNRGLTYANPLRTVLDALKVDLHF